MSSLIDKNIIPVVAVVILDKSSDHFLIVRRAENQSGGGFWEFPGGKIEIIDGVFESQTQALAREINEELGLTVSENQLHFLISYKHAYALKTIYISFYLLAVDQAVSLTLIDHDLFAWCKIEDLFNYQIAAADISVIEYLKKTVKIK